MNDMTPTREQRSPSRRHGLASASASRTSFTQGKGNYVDDVKLPGMLHGDFVRSPHAHARISRSTGPLTVPGVLAVITAETLKQSISPGCRRLAGDVQMVLADPARFCFRTRKSPCRRHRPLCRR